MPHGAVNYGKFLEKHTKPWVGHFLVHIPAIFLFELLLFQATPITWVFRWAEEKTIKIKLFLLNNF